MNNYRAYKARGRQQNPNRTQTQQNTSGREVIIRIVGEKFDVDIETIEAAVTTSNAYGEIAGGNPRGAKLARQGNKIAGYTQSKASEVGPSRNEQIMAEAYTNARAQESIRGAQQTYEQNRLARQAAAEEREREYLQQALLEQRSRAHAQYAAANLGAKNKYINAVIDEYERGWIHPEFEMGGLESEGAWDIITHTMDNPLDAETERIARERGTKKIRSFQQYLLETGTEYHIYD